MSGQVQIIAPHMEGFFDEFTILGQHGVHENVEVDSVLAATLDQAREDSCLLNHVVLVLERSDDRFLVLFLFCMYLKGRQHTSVMEPLVELALHDIACFTLT